MADLSSLPVFWPLVLVGFVFVELLVTVLIVRFSSGSGPERK